MPVVYPMKIKDEIIPIIEMKSKEEHTNKAIVLKQLIYGGIEDYVIKLCAKGRLSIGKAAEILDLSIYDIYEKAKKHGIKLSATEEQRIKSKALLKRLTAKSKLKEKDAEEIGNKIKKGIAKRHGLIE